MKVMIGRSTHKGRISSGVLGAQQLNGINIIGRIGVAVAVVAVHIVKFNVVVQFAADEVHRLVDFDRLRELAVGLQVSGLSQELRISTWLLPQVTDTFSLISRCQVAYLWPHNAKPAHKKRPAV